MKNGSVAAFFKSAQELNQIAGGLISDSRDIRNREKGKWSCFGLHCARHLRSASPMLISSAEAFGSHLSGASMRISVKSESRLAAHRYTLNSRMFLRMCLIRVDCS